MIQNYKKLIALALCLCMSASAFACSDSGTSTTDEDSEETTFSLESTKQDLTFTYKVSSGDEESEEDDESANEDSITSTSSDDEEVVETYIEAVTEVVEVTDENGEAVTDENGEVETEIVEATELVPVTEVVEVTDENGETVTDENGEIETEIVEVTEIVEESNEDGEVETKAVVASSAVAQTTVIESKTTSSTSNHVVSNVNCLAYWFDMSALGDYYFEGEFMVFEFVLAEDLEDGYYPITVSSTDIGSWELVTQVPTIISGGILVGEGTAEEQAVAAEGEFTLTVDSINAKAGDTIEVAIQLDNNPGFCAFIIYIEYDENAMTMTDAYGGEDFNKSISTTSSS